MAAKSAKGKVKKVVLAYSGGLDTSIILKWLQNDLRRRGRHLHGRPRPGRGAGAGAAQGRDARHQEENIFIEDVREEFVRDFVFPMFRANAVYEGVYLLGTSIARPADRQAADRDRAADRRRRRLPRRHRQGQRPGPLRARLLRARARHQDHRAVARMGLQESRPTCSNSPRAPDPDRQGQAGRGALLGRRQPAALLLRGQGAGGSRQEAPEYVHQRTISPMDAPDKATDITIGFEQGDRGRARRREAVAGHAAGEAQRARPRQRHRPPRSGREPLRRHEVARRLRDAGRHHPAGRASGDRSRSRSIAAPRTSRTS